MSTASVLKAVRLTHLYVGAFVAPAILFFAFTGAIQTFSLHETTRGSSYQPPRILVVLGQIHKKQTPIIATRKPDAAPKPAKHDDQPGPAAKSDHAPDAAASAAPPAAPKVPAQAPPDAPKHNPLPLKIFFLLVAISLFTSTFTGIYMSYKYAGNKALITTLLILGIVIPVLMILI